MGESPSKLTKKEVSSEPGKLASKEVAQHGTSPPLKPRLSPTEMPHVVQFSSQPPGVCAQHCLADTG